MIRLAISVEGPTERDFVNRLLEPHLRDHGVYATPIVVSTKRVASGLKHRGGSINIDRVKSEVGPLLHSFDQVTTLYDFYGFRGKTPGDSPELLMEQMTKALDTPDNFLPYVQLHEFEALLFSSPQRVAGYLGCSQASDAMQDIVQQCGGAELVNDDPQTAPSKRLTQIFRDCDAGYQKTFHGAELAVSIGMEKIRRACPRFDTWVTRLEHLSD